MRREMRILVVDDERAVRESLRRALELEGYDVDLAEDGESALERLSGTAEADAVILDVLMFSWRTSPRGISTRARGRRSSTSCSRCQAISGEPWSW